MAVFDKTDSLVVFEAFEYVRTVAETGAFQDFVFECTFEAAFETFKYMRARVRPRC